MADELQGFAHESAGQLQPKETEEAKTERAIVDEIVDNLSFTKSYEDLQRKCETEELEFEGLDPWGEEARTARGEHDDKATGMNIPAKPTIAVHLLDQNVQQVVTEGRQARLSLTVKPKSGLANTKTSDYLKGLVRTIQVESGSLEIRLWALERTAKVGRGGWLVEADFADDGDFDIDLRARRILDYSTVYWDPYAQKADRSDAEWCIASDWISERERKRRWPKKPMLVPNDGEKLWSEDHDWFAADAANPDNRRCRIATYYKIVHTSYTLGFHPAFGRGWVGKAPAKARNIPVMPEEYAKAVESEAEGTRRREVDVRTVEIYVVDGTQVLEQHDWLGKFIPVIELIGKEYFLRGKRRFKGIIANAMDLVRAINVLISSATEIAGSMPRTPYIMYEGQDENFEDMWDDSPVKNYTRLYIKAVEIGGKPAPFPQRQQTEIQIQGLLLLLRMMHEMYHAVTGSVAPQMRAVNPYDRSGKAIEALQRQGAAGTSNYLDNMATVSMLYEGKVYIDAIPNYYDKPGRVISVNGEGESDDDVWLMIKRPFIRGKDGQPMPVPCPACQGEGEKRVPFSVRDVSTWTRPREQCTECHGEKYATRDNMPEVWEDKEVEYVDFGEGEYKAIAAVDRSYQVQQQEALAGMEMLSQAAPQLVPSYADLWVRAMAFSGSNEIADRIKARMPEGSEDMQDIPPALMGKFMQLKQRHDQAMQALDEAQKMLQSDAMKVAGQKEIALIRDAMSQKVEKLRIEGRMLEKQTTLASDERLEVLRANLERMQQESTHRHERMLQTMDERHEIVLQLLKEQTDKEIERHSVELHDAAAAAAADRADLSATKADVRKDALATTTAARNEATARAADARGEASARAADTRKEASAQSADARAAASAESADARAEDAAERAAARDLQKPTNEA